MNKSDVSTLIEKQGQIICDIFSNNRKVVIWGCGLICNEIAPVFIDYGLVECFIDNDCEKQSKGWKGYDVVSSDYYFSRNTDSYVIIAASDKNTAEISEWLVQRGLKKGKDFAEAYSFLKNVFPYLSFYGYKKVYVEVSQICLTERCTLNCKKCAHGCNKVPMNKADMPWEVIKRSADYFFAKVDYVREFVLIGGEPFLSKELGRAIEYIGKKYRPKIGMFSITTNGTIVPRKEIIEICEKYDVTLRISNYELSIPRLKKTYIDFDEAVQNLQRIVWKTNEIDSWFDYGFGEVDNGEDAISLCRVFQKCRTICSEVRDNRFYYCVMARSVSDNCGYDIGLDEYYDLSKNEPKEEFLAYEMGYIPNGYLSMCRYCRGADAKKYPIPAAEQE